LLVMGGLLLPVQAGNGGEHDRKAVHDHSSNFNGFSIFSFALDVNWTGCYTIQCTFMLGTQARNGREDQRRRRQSYRQED
jgi:hypothetical protein